MRNRIEQSWTYRLVCWGYAMVFFYAGVSKLLDPEHFAVIIEAFGIVPETMLMPVAISLPTLEVIAALGLLTRARVSLHLVAGLLVLFLTILGYGIWLGLDIDCGCFGPSDPEGEAYAGLRPAFYRNLVLIAGVLYLYISRYKQARSQ